MSRTAHPYEKDGKVSWRYREPVHPGKKVAVPVTEAEVNAMREQDMRKGTGARDPNDPKNWDPSRYKRGRK